MYALIALGYTMVWHHQPHRFAHGEVLMVR
jgi:branched-subunit amino acid ABC-type transport system permease component